MYKKFIPSEYKKTIFDITPEDLKARGIRGIITDLDNTLVEWDRPDATPKLIEWLASMKQSGIKVVIVSNNNEMRVKSFSEPLGIPFIFQARKPMGKAFRRAIKVLDLQRKQIVVIGDQMLTDIFGGNRNKLHTILVLPVAKSDGFVTKFNRMVERRIMKKLKQQGQVTWEEKN